MTAPLSTCWSVIEADAAGSANDRAEFAHRYGGAVRAYLAARWRTSACLQDLDDAVQEVFLECFKPSGVLVQAQRGRAFRPFLYGVTRNVALRFETGRGQHRRTADAVDLAAVPDDAESLSRVFDWNWAKTIMREAAARMAERARQLDAAACRRVELLQLRFHEGLPIRAIAARWQTATAALHHEYAKARQEFRAVLVEVLAFHHPGSALDIEQECANLLTLLG